MSAERRISLPADQMPGSYTIGIRLPDKSPSIHGDPRYAVRFANTGIWVESTGTNVLTKDLTVSTATPGNEKSRFTKFAEIAGDTGL